MCVERTSHTWGKKHGWKTVIQLIGGTQIKFSSSPGLMERQIEFDISDYTDRSILIDTADIAKPHVEHDY